MKPQPPCPLSSETETYLQSLEMSLRPSSCRKHRYVLRMWYEWLESKGTSVLNLSRDDVVNTCRWLHERGLQPGTRANYLVVIRGYLRYLFVHEYVQFHPDSIFYRTDIPKIPDRLPRVLSPEVDTELQRRLAQSDKPMWRGLLLMRKTGIRVGELLSLPYDCVRRDHDANHFLKVPLGKLNSERLVPIADDAIAIIEYLQQLPPQPRSWLFLAPRRPTPPCYTTARDALKAAVLGLEDKELEPITSHRLRHSYASELLNAGMSMASIQSLLGHRSPHMTQHYARISLSAMAQEYHAALAKTQERYQDCLPSLSDPQMHNLGYLAADLARQVSREAGERAPSVRAKTHRLARRLRHIAAQLQKLGL